MAFFQTEAARNIIALYQSYQKEWLKENAITSLPWQNYLACLIEFGQKLVYIVLCDRFIRHLRTV